MKLFDSVLNTNLQDQIDDNVAESENILVIKGNGLHRLILLIVAGCALTFTIANIISDKAIDTYLTIALVPTSIFYIYLFKKGYHILSKILNLFTVVTVITLLTIIDGRETFSLVFYIPVLLSTLIIFRGTERKLGYYLTFLTLVIFIILLTCDLDIGIHQYFNKEQLEGEFIVNLGGATIVTVLEVLFILGLSENIQNKLVRQRINLKQNNNILNATIHTRDKITGIISHDIRGPMASISAALKLVDWSNYMTEEEKALMTEIQNRTDATVDLIDNLLMWSKSQTNQISFQPEFVSMKEIKQIIDSIVELQGASKIEVKTELPNEGSINADKTLLYSILRNLFANSLKFTPANGTISIQVKEVKNGFEFSVTDSGIGMNNEAIQKIRFGQSHSTIGLENQMGHGLGLQLVREFVHKHGSELDIQSEVGKGTQFSFVLAKAPLAS